MIHESFNESVEMYLKTVTELAAEGALVPISALSARLGVSTVSATEMVHRLCDRSLLAHTPYKGVELTEDGARRAVRLIRSHRLWEHFLYTHLQMPWAAVHDHACRMEHATDPAVAEALAVFLGHPTRCPHGNPIPDVQGRVPGESSRPLAQLQPGARGVVARVYPESTLLLDYLDEQEIQPGRELIFEEVAPFNGPLLVTVDGREHALGHEIAAHIFVETVPQNAALHRESPDVRVPGDVRL